MPMYSWYCATCDVTTEQFFHVKDLPETVTCANCGRDCRQDLTAKRANVQPDNFAYPKDMSSIFGTPAHSKSEMKQMMRRYDEKHGTKLETV